MRRLPLFIAVLMLVLFAPLPAQAATKICFKEVSSCIEGRFADYWKQNGGLAIFGFPLNAAHQERIEGKSYLVQLFERNRFELHPEKQRPYDVLLGRLGDERLRQIGRDWQNEPKVSAAPGDLCFLSKQTGHVTCSDFFIYFRTHGLEFDGKKGLSEAESIALFGLPLTEAAQETGSDGKPYLTQWFERALRVPPRTARSLQGAAGPLGCRGHARHRRHRRRCLRRNPGLGQRLNHAELLQGRR